MDQVDMELTIARLKAARMSREASSHAAMLCRELRLDAEIDGDGKWSVRADITFDLYVDGDPASLGSVCKAVLSSGDDLDILEVLRPHLGVGPQAAARDGVSTVNSFLMAPGWP